MTLTEFAYLIGLLAPGLLLSVLVLIFFARGG